MFLYELAIELDRRSGELVDAAEALGLGTFTTSAALDATQEHRLRQHFGAPTPAGAAIPAERGIPGAVVHQALADGFGWILLYGGIGVWLLAAASYLAFGRRAEAKGACPAAEATR